MLNQETIIKLAEQHGFKVGRDAGGEYVAPKYEDAVGSLVALVQAAYAMGQQAQQAVVSVPDELTSEDIEQLRLALSWEGYSTPEGLENCAARWPSLVRDLIDSVLVRRRRMLAAQKGGA